MIALPPRYQTVKTLPGGGMSDTLLCYDQHLQRNVVFKSLKFGVSQKRILDELSALSSIRSDYVVQVLDVIRSPTGDVIGFIEEFIDGSEIDHANFSGIDQVLKFLYAVASGVHDIHRQGRVHRDLKPDNMKIDQDGILKIFDFGLAKTHDDKGTKQFYYTAGFTAPEAFKKNPTGLHEFSKEIDVFAFGAIALWVLNGGAIPACMYDCPATVPIPPLTFTGLKIEPPGTVSPVLAAALAITPGDRPSMQDVCTVLRNELLRDTHRMLLTNGGNTYLLDRSNRSTRISSGSSFVEIAYDGVHFTITGVGGSVEINNMAPRVGATINGSVVIVLAEQHRRVFVTADVSHPEAPK